jgi:hypothetical protein
MPRKARIDAPGALNHIICRGIERRKIFYKVPIAVAITKHMLRKELKSDVDVGWWAQDCLGAVVCYWAVRELGMSGTSAGNLLSLGLSAVSRKIHVSHYGSGEINRFFLR